MMRRSWRKWVTLPLLVLWLGLLSTTTVSASNHPWNVMVGKANFPHYGVAASMKIGAPASEAPNQDNSIVQVISTRSNDAVWWIETGYRYWDSCDCWAIFYGTNTLNGQGVPDNDPNTRYWANVGPANAGEFHNFAIYRDATDTQGWWVQIDGWNVTKLPLYGTSQANWLVVNQGEILENSFDLNGSRHMESLGYYYTSENQGGKTALSPPYSIFNCSGAFPKYYYGYSGNHVDIYGPQLLSPPPGC